MEHKNAILLLGGNQGDRMTFLSRAKEEIGARAGRIIAVSAVYETEPWGQSTQEAFLNAVIELETGMSPEQLLDTLLSIEADLGRERAEKWGPRVIDIDILFYSDLVLKGDRLTIPHPHLHLRNFTLVPLAEIKGNLIHPVLEKTIQELLVQSQDILDVKVYAKNL